jgi:hypothetical protein
MTLADEWIIKRLEDAEVHTSYGIDLVTEILDKNPTLRVGRRDLVDAIAHLARAQWLLQDIRSQRLLPE